LLIIAHQSIILCNGINVNHHQYVNWQPLGRALIVANCCSLVAVCKKTAKRNILVAAQFKHNKDDKIIVLAPPALKNNNQRTMVTERSSKRTRQAMEGWEREVRGQGKDGVGGEERNKANPIDKAGGGGETR
jgi:hypothetical protein